MRRQVASTHELPSGLWPSVKLIAVLQRGMCGSQDVVEIRSLFGAMVKITIGVQSIDDALVPWGGHDASDGVRACMFTLRHGGRARDS